MPDRAGVQEVQVAMVWMQELDQAKSLQHAMHIDLSVAREHVKSRLEAAVAAPLIDA